VNGQLDVKPLLRVFVTREQPGEIVLDGRIQPRFRTASAVVVFTDVDLVREDRGHLAGGRPGVEDHLGVEVALVEAVEVHLEDASDVGLVVREIVERDVVDLDGAVVARRILRRRHIGQLAGNHRNSDAHSEGQSTGQGEPPASGRT
jgi:hypothetical protein